MKKSSGKAERISSWIAVALSAFLACGVMLIFHACGPKDDGSWMSCHYAQLAVFGLALVMTVLDLIAVFLKRTAAMILRILAIVCAVLAAVIPGNVIGLCMMNEMRCRAVMRPSVILVSVLCIFAQLAAMALAGKDR